MTVTSAVLIFVLGTWLLITILGQFRFNAANPIIYGVHWLKWHDYFGLIPGWFFFTPDPAAAEYSVMHREQMGDESFTPWRPLEARTNPRLRSLWNPGLRRKVALLDMCMRVERLGGLGRPRGPSKDLFISLPYRALLQCVVDQPHTAGSVSTQFMITITSGRRETMEPKIVFISPLHNL